MAKAQEAAEFKQLTHTEHTNKLTAFVDNRSTEVERSECKEAALPAGVVPEASRASRVK